MSKLRIENKFAVTPNQLLNNPEISFKAKGLYGYLQSKPDNWEFAVNRIKNDGKEGRDGIISGIQELEQFGYLVRNKFKNSKGHWDVDYVLYDTPVTDNPQPTVTDYPVSEKPVPDNPETYKERNTNKEIIKKELLYSQDSFEFLLAERFLFAHIDNQTPSIIYKLKTKTEDIIIQEFSSDIEKIKRIDGYSEKEINFIFDFIISDSKIQNPGKKFYWLDQIQTPSKLRQKNKEGIPYFVVLIEPAKKNYICNSSIGTPTVT